MYTPPKKPTTTQSSFFSKISRSIRNQHLLFILANKINWQLFEVELSKHYNKANGALAKPIRMMVGLLILKHLGNVSDEVVVEQWAENIYYQNKN